MNILKASILCFVMLFCCSVTVLSYADDYDSYSVEELTQKAEQDYCVYQYKLGDMYRTGEGVKEDKKEAERWFKKAAKSCLIEAEDGKDSAQYCLAELYLYGFGLQKLHRKKSFADVVERVKKSVVMVLAYE